LRSLGRFEEAIEEAKRALELDPFWFETNVGVGATYFWAGRYDEAIEQFKKTIDLDPNYPDVHDFLADAYARKKMFAEAMNEEEEYLKLRGDPEGAKQFRKDSENFGYLKAREFQYQRELDLYLQAVEDQYIPPITIATLYSQLNQKDKAFEWLEKVYEEKSSGLPSIKTSPEFENLRSDPRFSQLMKRVGLPY
jgi:tetratricopeptide (TPR) repeat protein